MASESFQGIRRTRLLILLIPLLATFFLFVLLLAHQRETSNPALAVERLKNSGKMMQLDEWGFQFKNCPQSGFDKNDAATKNDCRFLSLGQETIRLPDASTLTELLRRRYAETNVASGEHTFSEATRQWLAAMGSKTVSLVVPHSVQNAAIVRVGSRRWVTFGMGVPIHTQISAEDLLKEGHIRIDYLMQGLPWFGPPDLPPAFMAPEAVAEYTALRERQIGTSNMASIIHIGFPLLVAAVAVVLDHSFAIFLLSLVSATQAMRSFIAHMVNYEWLGGSLAKLLTLVSNGLTAACLLLLALEIAGHRRVNNIHRVAIFFGVPLLSVPLLFADDMVFLKSDAIFDFASSALAALMILTGIWIALREKADSLQGNLPTASSFLSTELPLTITKLSLASCGLVIYAHANFKDLTQVQNNGFKDFLDWQHLVLLPTLIAACLIDVGSTSRKMFAFARSMVKKAMLERELELGKEVQQKMLPPRRSEAAGFAWRSMYLPASALAGDWYDVRELVFSDGTSCLVACLADVTGHGAGAALSTGVISAQWGLWCQWAAKQQNRPTTQQESAEILSQAPARINEGLLALRSNENCTAIFMLFDASTRSVTVCSAGHPGALLWNGDRFEYLMGRGDRLGAGIPEQPWVAITKELRPGSLVVVFSDGLVPIGKTVSSWISGLSRQVRRDQHKPFGLMLAQQVRENRRAFKTSVRAEDDITVVAVGFAAEEQQASAPDERPSSMNAQPLGA